MRTKPSPKKNKEDSAHREAQERTTFKPHLWVIAEREIPSPIFAVAIFGQDQFRRVPLPKDIAALPEQKQEAIIRCAAKEHFLVSSGRAGPFGAITGFVYRRTFDEGWTLSVNGEVINRTAGRLVIGEARLFLKKRRIDPVIRKSLKEPSN